MTQPDDPVDIVSSAREFLDAAGVTREDSWRVIDRADQAGQRADASFAKRMVAFVGTWLAAYAISGNLITEASVGSFQLSQLPLIVLLAPAILAILMHHGFATILASKVTAAIERSGYRKLFPNTERRHVDAVTFAATPLGLEGIIASRTLKASSFLWLTSGLLLIFVFAGPFLLIGHALYLSITATTYPEWAKWLVAGATVFVALRSAFLLIAIFRFPHD